GFTSDFFAADRGRPCVSNFTTWVRSEADDPRSAIFQQLTNWIPTSVTANVKQWAENVAADFLGVLQAEGAAFMARFNSIEHEDESDEDDENKLLDFFFARGLLPTYAFPTDLCSFSVERVDPQTRRVQVKEKPQQAISKALTEYA